MLVLAALMAAMSALLPATPTQAGGGPDCTAKVGKTFTAISGGFQTTYTARSGNITRVELLAGTSANANVVIEGRPYTTFPQTITLTNPTASVTVKLFRQQANTAAVTVAVKVYDDCGAWPDFFGKGGGTPSTPPPPVETITQIPDGQTVASGTVARVEVVDYVLKIVRIFGGTLPKSFKTSQNTPEGVFRAWTGYSSVQSAQTACQTLSQQRRDDPFFKNGGFSVTCESDYNKLPGYWLDRHQLEEGLTVTPGTLGLFEQIDFGRKYIVLYGGRNEQNFKTGVITETGPITNGVWVGYPDETTAAQDALRHRARRQGNSFFNGYDIYMSPTPP
jgi:hypothetical protein